MSNMSNHIITLRVDSLQAAKIMTHSYAGVHDVHGCMSLSFVGIQSWGAELATATCQSLKGTLVEVNFLLIFFFLGFVQFVQIFDLQASNHAFKRAFTTSVTLKHG